VARVLGLAAVAIVERTVAYDTVVGGTRRATSLTAANNNDDRLSNWNNVRL